MASEPILLIAASGLAREALTAMRADGSMHPIGMLDDDASLHGLAIGGVGVLGGIDTAAGYPDVRLVVCVGSGATRADIVERLAAQGVGSGRYATVMHPSVRVPTNCTVGPGSILLANVVLTADVTIGAHVVVMPQVTLTHDVVVEDYATLCAGVSLGGGVHVGRAAYLGMNASVRQGVGIGDLVVLGMGAVALRDIPSAETWVGVPARQSQSRMAEPAGEVLASSFSKGL